MTAHDEAVRAVIEAIEPRARTYGLNGTETWNVAEAAVAAAAPILLAAERQRITEAIRAQRDLFDRADAVWIALDLAAVRIAERNPE